MARYPKISSPCPLKLTTLPLPGNDFCRRCERKVHNLSAMSTEEREHFMAGCETPVCVAYAVRRPAAALTLAAGALLAAGSALAQNTTAGQETLEPIILLIGGVKEPGQSQLVEFDDIDLPELPTIVENESDSDMSLFTTDASG